MIRSIFGLVISLTAVLWVTAGLSAADFDYDIESQYDIEKDGTTSVQHIVSVKNNTGDKGPSSFSFPVIGRDPSNFSANYQDGGNLKTSYDETSRKLLVNLPKDTWGKNKKWSFEINYDNILLENFGGTKIVQVPPLRDLGVSLSGQSLSIAADLDLGFGTSRGPEPSSTDIAIGKQVVSYQNLDGPFDQAATLIFGESAVSNVEINATLRNSSWWWKTVEFALPPDTNQQQVLLQSIEPEPSTLRLDTDGNVIVGFNLWPKQSVEVAAKGLVRINALTYDLSSTEKVNDIDPGLVERYTSSTDNWQPSGLEISTTSDDSAADIISKVHRAVAEQAAQDSINNIDLASRNFGLQYSDQLVGELRSRGIPARLVLGKVWSNGSELLEKPINHAWTEAYAPGVGWMTLDPVMSSTTDYFGTTNVMHIGLVLWGIADNRPPINLDTVSVRYTDSEFSVSGDAIPQISAKKYVVLPGISILSITAQTPPGSIQDNTAVRTSGDSAVIPLGSLAPLQTAKTRALRMGGDAFSSENVDFGVLIGDTLTTTASAESQVSYLIVFYEVGAIVFLALIVGVVKVRRNRMNRNKTSHDSVLMHEEAEGGNIEDENLVNIPKHMPDEEQPSDTLPDVVEPELEQPPPQSADQTPPQEKAKKDGTIEQTKNPGEETRRPPHRHLIQ